MKPLPKPLPNREIEMKGNELPMMIEFVEMEGLTAYRNILETGDQRLCVRTKAGDHVMDWDAAVELAYMVMAEDDRASGVVTMDTHEDLEACEEILTHLGNLSSFLDDEDLEEFERFCIERGYYDPEESVVMRSRLVDLLGLMECQRSLLPLTASECVRKAVSALQTDAGITREELAESAEGWRDVLE